MTWVDQQPSYPSLEATLHQQLSLPPSLTFPETGKKLRCDGGDYLGVEMSEDRP